MVVNKNPVCTNVGKANALAHAFESAHTLTRGNISPIDRNVLSFIEWLNETSDFTLPDNAIISSVGIKEVASKLRNSKAPGIDGVTNILIKRLPERAFQILARIFNACLKTGYFPNRFKIAKVKAIPKPGKDQRDPSNYYRPISLLSCIGKMFEKLIHCRFQAHAESNNLINPEQFGFRRQHSTVHQLKRVTNYIRQKKAERKTTSMVLLDIENAFDTICHDGLIYKLNKNGTPMYLLKILRAFISNRQFMVEVNRVLSDPKKVVAGVPQGSVLSPILYATYIANFKGIKDCQSAYYADDTALYSATKTTNKSIKNVQRSLQSIDKFMTKWKIRINAAKTQFIIFPFNRSRRRIHTTDLRFLNNVIRPETTVKYLGVILDQKLNFDSHIVNARNKASKAMCAFYPLRAETSKLNLKNKNVVYKTMIRPIITYAAPIWCHATKSRMKKLQILQNKCLKQINNLPWRFGTEDLHSLTGYPKITDLLKA